jgi:SAM-dependent methyltransferase
LLRQFDKMYRNCPDPHGQSLELERVDYQLVAAVLSRVFAGCGAARRLVRVLDVGCGLGYFTSHVKELLPNAEVSGCDISATAVKKAAARAPDCSFYTLDIGARESAPKGKYDILVALDVLYYFTVAEIPGVVRNLRSMLRGAGHLLVGYHLPQDMSFGLYIRSLEDARALFAAHGFEFRLTLDLVNELDRTYAGDAVGRHIYFLVQKRPAKRAGRLS